MPLSRLRRLPTDGTPPLNEHNQFHACPGVGRRRFRQLRLVRALYG